MRNADFGILDSSVYTFQECGRQEINFLFVLFGARCQVSGVKTLNPEP